jgi:hypothetical protein
MNNLKERIADVSQYLQHLVEPKVFQEVQSVIEKGDKKSLVEVCKKNGIPEIYIGIVISVLLSVTPTQKWPMPQF